MELISEKEVENIILLKNQHYEIVFSYS